MGKTDDDEYRLGYLAGPVTRVPRHSGSVRMLALGLSENVAAERP